LRSKNKGSWDARTYDEVSRLVQYRWGQQVLKWRKWRGDEIVIDAGCGSGLLTKQLAKKVPRGKVYAVDIDSNMIKQAKNNLQFFDNVEIIQSNFTDIRIPSSDHVILPNRRTYSKFVKTVVMKSYLDYLSRDNVDDTDKLRTLFLDSFLDEVKKRSNNNKSSARWFLDFIRLNIIAHRP